MKEELLQQSWQNAQELDEHEVPKDILAIAGSLLLRSKLQMETAVCTTPALTITCAEAREWR